MRRRRHSQTARLAAGATAPIGVAGTRVRRRGWSRWPRLARVDARAHILDVEPRRRHTSLRCRTLQGCRRCSGSGRWHVAQRRRTRSVRSGSGRGRVRVRHGARLDARPVDLLRGHLDRRAFEERELTAILGVNSVGRRRRRRVTHRRCRRWRCSDCTRRRVDRAFARRQSGRTRRYRVRGRTTTAAASETTAKVNHKRLGLARRRRRCIDVRRGRRRRGRRLLGSRSLLGRGECSGRRRCSCRRRCRLVGRLRHGRLFQQTLAATGAQERALSSRITAHR